VPKVWREALIVASVLLMVHRPASRLPMPKIWREALIAAAVFLLLQRPGFKLKISKEYYQETIECREASVQSMAKKFVVTEGESKRLTLCCCFFPHT
jgi:hypothetical protein